VGYGQLGNTQGYGMGNIRDYDLVLRWGTNSDSRLTRRIVPSTALSMKS
jgi:hypothetical protein